MKRLWNKKFTTRTLCILLVAGIAALALAPNHVLAQTTIGGAAGSALAKIGQGSVIVGYVYGALWLLLTFLSSIVLAFASALLEFAYTLNIATDPAQIPVVQEGWRVLRDLANGLLILVIVWIALTIIFDLEEYGGKKLLVRVIAAGLLINFSLVIVSIPFALANQLARPFVKALQVHPECKAGPDVKCNSLSAIIINNSKIHQVTKIVGEGEVDEFKKDLGTVPVDQSSSKGSDAGKYLGAPTAHAAGPLLAFLGWLGYKAAVVAVTAIAGVVATGLLALGIYLSDVHIIIFNMAVANILLFFLIISVATAAILLFLRVVAMIFLGVFAPIAFISMAVPRYGERIWNYWVENLLRWAFLAPVFYFLLYLALLFLQINADAVEILKLGNVSISANLYKVINLVFFLIFLWAAVFFTRKMAGQFAEVALSGLRRGLGYAGGYALGAAQRRLLPQFGQMAEKAQERIGRIPWQPVRRILKQPAAALRGVAKAGRDQILRDQQEFKSMTSAEIQRTIGAGGLTESRLAAAMLTLQQSKDLTPLKDSRGNLILGYSDDAQLRGKDIIRKAGLDITGFLRANPELARATDFTPRDLASDEAREERARAQRLLGFDQPLDDDQFAQWLAWGRVRPQDYDSMDLGVLTRELQQKMFLASQRGESFTRLGRINPARAQQIQDRLEQNPAIWNQFDDKKKDYFISNAARELVWARPAYADRPAPGSAGPETQGSAGGTASPGGGQNYVIQSRPIQNRRLNQDYTLRLEVQGGGTPVDHTWRVAPRSQLPPGLTLNPQTGVISGTPTAAGPHAFYVELLDPNQNPVANRMFTIDVQP